MPQMLESKQDGAAPEQFVKPAEFSGKRIFVASSTEPSERKTLTDSFLFLGFQYICTIVVMTA